MEKLIKELKQKVEVGQYGDIKMKAEDDSYLGGYCGVFFKLAFPGAQELIYTEVGSYQGDFYILAEDATGYLYYKGCYGSCSGCDALQAVNNVEDLAYIVEGMRNRAEHIVKENIENFLSVTVAEGMRDNWDEKEAKVQFLDEALKIIRIKQFTSLIRYDSIVS